MEYSNPQIPEGINTTREHPLKDLLLLGGGIIGLIVSLVVILSLLAEYLAPYIPFAMEEELATRFVSASEDTSVEYAYLQKLSNELSAQMSLPDEMHITLHYIDDDVENAFATLGGHIFIHRGLLELLPDENALSMVIAHEIAHIRHRHPLIAMGRGVVIGLFLLTVTGLSGDRLTAGIIGNTGTLTALGFSRKQEREADRSAMIAVEKYYGHVNGATGLFKALFTAEQNNPFQVPQFLNTHPLSAERIERLNEMAARHKWSTTNQTRPLPDFFKKHTVDN